MILFLDFDGVLHGHFGCPLFEHLERLEEVLREHPEVRVVLSTSWREIYPFEELKGFFSEDIRPRIIGKTPVIMQREPPYQPHVRYREIQQWLLKHGREARAGHVILDDHEQSFPAGLDELVLCDATAGFDLEAEARLRQKLRQGKGGGMIVLFLDYDGVLHPHEVYRRNGEISIDHDRLPDNCRDATLFMWADILVDILKPYLKLKLVLSTSWVSVLGFNAARARLPAALQSRTIGGTFHSALRREWEQATRADQILSWRARSGDPTLHGWLALDDLGEGEHGPWPASLRGKLVLTDSVRGLGDPAVQAELRRKLAALHEQLVGGDES